MKEIKLYNRDRADLRLVNRENSDLWDLVVDKDHEYCLKYMRMGGEFKDKNDPHSGWKSICMVDPSGGPYIEIGDTFENKYKVVEILDATVLRLIESEGNNN